MEDLTKYTPTELLKQINDAQFDHEKLKQEIIELTYEIDKIEVEINSRLVVLTETENKYISLIEELNNR